MKQNRPEHVDGAPLAGRRVLEGRVARDGCRRATPRTSVWVTHVDAGVGLDPLDEILRHRLGERAAGARPATRGTSAGPCRSRPGRPSCRRRPRSRRSRRRSALRDRSPRSTRPRPRSVRGRRPRAAGTRAPDATITARLGISLPSASTITWKPCSTRRPATSHGALSRAPSRMAWIAALAARSSPETPFGKPT